MVLRDEKRLESFNILNGSAQPLAIAEEVFLGGKVANLAAKAVTRLWGSLDVALAGKVGASNTGNISARQITESGVSVRLTTTELKTIAQIDNMINTTLQGDAREYVANSYFARNGFSTLEGKCGSGCFDGVYLKGDKVYINEVKPLNANGTIKLSGPNEGTGLQTQMTNEWIDYAVSRLRESASLESRRTADIVEAAKQSGNLVKVVSGVNQNGMAIVRLQ
jgi:filamentous hemagglutinin